MRLGDSKEFLEYSAYIASRLNGETTSGASIVHDTTQVGRALYKNGS